MPSILILAAGPLCRNPRVLKEATTLSKAGFEVTVTSIANNERFEEYDREILRGVSFHRIALDRLSRRPLDRLVALAERAAGWLACRLVRYGIESPFSLGPYYAFRRMALSIPADLTIVHAELPFCVGIHLISKGRRVAADFEDWHSRDLLPESRAFRPLRLLERAEGTLMRKAAYVSAPSNAMATALQAAYGGVRPLVVLNTFPLEPEPSRLPRTSPPSFFWFSQTIGPGRGIEEFLAAWALTHGASQVCLLGDISESFRAELTSLVPEARRQWIRFLPLTSPRELNVVIASQDLGLALEPNTPESRYLTVTNKIFQYLNAGLAVVASPTAGQLEVMTNIPESGLVVDLGNPRLVAEQLDTLLSDFARLAAMGVAARSGAIRHYCWEVTAPLLVARVTSALARTGANT
jgi:glycosyltransferase involved in cell wall biosynthesis